MEKVALFNAMQTKYYTLDVDDRKMYITLLNELTSEIASLNRNYIGVQKNLQHIEKYANPASWVSMDNNKLLEIKKHVAPQINGDIDVESARIFDQLAYRFSATKFQHNNEFALTAKTIYKLATYLSVYKNATPEVVAHQPSLDYLQSNDFIVKTTVSQMEKLRKELRHLMKYIERDVLTPIISDFTDSISATGDADENDIDFSVSIDDFKTFDEKAAFYINTHTSDALVSKIMNLYRYTDDDFKLFESEMKKIAKDDAEYNSLFDTHENIVIYIRKNIGITKEAIDRFLEIQKAQGKNEEQLNYIEALLIFIAQNGQFKRQDLLKEELRCINLFDSVEIRQLLEDVENVL